MSTFVGGPCTGERVAVSTHPRGSRTWTHAAYATGHDGVSPTRCGRRLADPTVVWRGADAWKRVSCTGCIRAMRQAG